MSYILDALKKAEAERNPGAVPNLHTQAVRAAPPPAPRSLRDKPWIWIMPPLLTAVLAGIAWFKPWEAPQPSPPKTELPEQAPPAPPIPPIAANPAPASVKKKPATAPAKPAPAARPAIEQPRIPALHELPDSIRREIPPFKINGYIYSRNKAERSVLIGQKLLQEGDQVAPDVTLEKMTPDGMVLNYKGHRYRAPYQ